MIQKNIRSKFKKDCLFDGLSHKTNFEISFTIKISSVINVFIEFKDLLVKNMTYYKNNKTK